MSKKEKGVGQRGLCEWKRKIPVQQFIQIDAHIFIDKAFLKKQYHKRMFRGIIEKIFTK